MKTKHLVVTVFTKGSPEMVLSFCKEDDFNLLEIHRFLKEETGMGHRVLALASKKIDTTEINDILSLSRSTIESDLQLCGFVVFENSVKQVSKESIASLARGGLRSIMATGDYSNTALYVAHEVGMVEPNQIVYQLKVKNNSLVYENMEKVSPRLQSSENSWNEENEKSALVLLDEETSIKYCCVLTGILRQPRNQKKI